MDPLELGGIQEAIRRENLDGWLFCNFQHRDKLADSILNISGGEANSRLWFYVVPAWGEPFKLVHAVEAGILDGLAGTKAFYISREDLGAALSPLGGKRWAVHSSEALPAVSFLDAGTAAFLEKAGLVLVSAASLIQRFRGLLDAAGIASHERAAAELYGIVDLVWDRVRRAWSGKLPLREGDLRDWMLEEMERRGLLTGHPPIVAAGANSGNPHYGFTGRGDPVQEGDLIQLDLWAKERTPSAIYADISWVGVFSGEAPAKMEQRFADLVSAREGAWRFIEAELAAGRDVSGAMVDRETRKILARRGYGEALKHRTGHGIDTECHGSGVNMDSVEFPDSRLLLEGACFSLEPGVYFSGFGMRTEIDVYIDRGKPVISGKNHERQFKLLTCRS
ncbi:MAG: M24 family metallopeptidase [Treponema sp.]|jgi:Xaa-Pro aminopeptidase|nr:M24 family metallopeptidase [Treponema sp.]